MGTPSVSCSTALARVGIAPPRLVRFLGAVEVAHRLLLRAAGVVLLRLLWLRMAPAGFGCGFGIPIPAPSTRPHHLSPYPSTGTEIPHTRHPSGIRQFRAEQQNVSFCTFSIAYNRKFQQQINSNFKQQIDSNIQQQIDIKIFSNKLTAKYSAINSQQQQIHSNKYYKFKSHINIHK